MNFHRNLSSPEQQSWKDNFIFMLECLFLDSLFSLWCGNGFKGMGRAFPALCLWAGWGVPACRRTRVGRRCGWASRAPPTTINPGSGKVRCGIWPLLPPEQFLGPSLLMAAKEGVQMKSHINPWAVSPSGKGSRGFCCGWGVSLQHHSSMGTCRLVEVDWCCHLMSSSPHVLASQLLI